MDTQKYKKEGSDYLTTPFPYAYATPHIGNLYQVLRNDILMSIRNAYYENNFYKRRTYSPYRGLHLTGLPIYLKVQDINEKLKTQSIETVFKNQGLSYMIPFLKTKGPLTLKDWYQTVRSYYSKILKELEINNCTEKEPEANQWYCTTAIDPQYHLFLNKIYEKLNVLGLLVEDYNYVFYCDYCKTIVGDHDRKNYEGHGVLSQKIQKRIIGDSTYLSSDAKDLQYYLVDENIQMSSNLIKKLYSTVPANVDLVVLTDGQKNLAHKLPAYKDLILKKQEALKESDVAEKVQTLYYGIGNILCRCNKTVTVRAERTMFIDFENLAWKALVLKRIKESFTDSETKGKLQLALKELRKVAFLRTAGFGSCLDIFKNTPYQNSIVDSLTDSMLFPYFAIDDQILEPSDKVSDARILAHTTGKDLLKNHILYFLMMSVLILPEKDLPTVITDAHIVDENNLKMSKSLNNVVNYEDLCAKNLAKKSILRTCITNMTDSTQNRKLVLSGLENINRSELKRASYINQMIDSLSDHLLEQNTDLKALLYLIAREVEIDLDDKTYLEAFLCSKRYHTEADKEPYKHYRLRHLKHLTYHHLYELLKNYEPVKSNPGINTVVARNKSSIGKLIKDIVSSLI